ncbi:hypothetical protein KTH_55410 [Thermosporothrix hazakensis]|nr:hypothetical protein KTH_55410 [Thermosporothrix hazakensis]
MTFLTDKQEPFVRTVCIAGMPTHRTRLARVVGIDRDHQTSRQLGFVGNHMLQLSKRPFREDGVGFPLFLARLLALLSSGSISNVSQMFQSNQMMGVLSHNAFGDHMIGVLLQPSLSSRDRQ